MFNNLKLTEMKPICLSTLTLILCFVLFGCEKDSEKTENVLDSLTKNLYYESEIFTQSFLDLYGKWNLRGISGGFSGTGYEPDFDYLEIKEIGIYGFIRNDSILEYGKITILHQTSETLAFTFNPDDNSETFMWDAEKYVGFHGKDTLNLNSPCCDRFNYHFTRVK